MEITTQKRRRQSRLVRYTINLLSVTLTLMAAGFIAPMAFGYQRYVITGSSMAGTYDVGTVVIEEVVPVNDLRVGDVITYLPPKDSGIDHLVTHRIHRIKDGSFRTKGDAVSQVDPWTFRLDQVSQPRVVLSVPYVGYLLIALQDRTTRMALLGIPAVLVALLSLFQLLAALRRRPDEQAEEKTPVSVSKPTVSVGG